MSATADQVIRCKSVVAWEAGKPRYFWRRLMLPHHRKMIRRCFSHLSATLMSTSGRPRIKHHFSPGFLVMKVQELLSVCVGEGMIELKPRETMCYQSFTERVTMISDGNSRFSINGRPIYHFLGTSTFSEYTVVHKGCVAKINPSAPLDKVCFVSRGFALVLVLLPMLQNLQRDQLLLYLTWVLLAMLLLKRQEFLELQESLELI